MSARPLSKGPANLPLPHGERVRVRGKGDKSMSWIYKLICPNEKYIWVKVRILHETEKAILVDNGMKIWIPKSQIYKIRLKKNMFEIYVKESSMV